MFSISRKTAKWVEKGLISQSQAREILAFEQSGKSGFSLFSVILFLGIFSIACGIAAIVSSNWFAIPDAVKITGMFLVLVGVAAASASIKEKHPVLFEGGLFFYMLLLFAAIGLVGQVYHLTSDSYKAFLFWSALAFPVMLLTHRVFMGYVWETVFLAAFSASPWGERLWRFFFENLFASALSLSFFSSALFLVLLTVGKARIFIEPVRTALAAVALFSLMLGGFDSTFFKAESWFPFVFVLMAAGFAFFVKRFSVFRRDEKKAVLVVTGLYVLFFFLPPFGVCIYLSQLTILFAFIYAAYCFGNEKIARLLAVLTAFRMLEAFFGLFGSLMETGIGLIVSGMVILGVAYAFFKADKFLKSKTAEKGESHD